MVSRAASRLLRLSAILLVLLTGGVTSSAVRAAPAAPSLTSPPDGAVLTSFGPALTWTNPPGVTQYHLQVLPSNNDGPGVDLQVGSPGTSFRVPPPPQWYGLLPDMTYAWRVRVSNAPTAVDPDHPSWSPWAVGVFRTPRVTADTITPVAPAPGAVVDTLAPTLQWANSRKDLYYYEVQLSRDREFTTDPATAPAMVYWELRHGGVTAPPNSYTVPADFLLEPATEYYWRVRPQIGRAHV